MPDPTRGLSGNALYLIHTHTHKLVMNIVIFMYLDDILVLAKSEKDCKNAIDLVKEYLTNLGLTISLDNQYANLLKLLNS